SPPSNGDEVTKFGGAKVGDLVQWESQGALQFPTPRRVRLVSEDGNWVAVEGIEKGLPMDEILVEGAPDNPRSEAPTFPLALDQHEAEWMRSRVGTDTKVRLLVEGDMCPKEIGKLIKL